MGPVGLRLQMGAFTGGIAALAVAALLFATSAQAVTSSYPAGGSDFDGGTQGWAVDGTPTCSIALLCSASGAYESDAGNQPGSISARTTTQITALGALTSTVTWTSPEFVVPAGSITDAEFRLERAFAPGALLSFGPSATYTVTLLDKTGGSGAVLLTEELTAESGFSANSAATGLLSDRTYQLSIETTTTATLGVGLLGGVTDVRFDNVALDVDTLDESGEEPGDEDPEITEDGGDAGQDGADGKDGQDGADGKSPDTRSLSITDRRLLTLVRKSSPRRAGMRGRRLMVRVKCPREARRACRIAAQGYLNRRRAVTNRRSIRVAPGRAWRVVLRVRPKFRQKVARRKRLLVRHVVRAGKAKARFFQVRRVVRRP